MESVRKLVERGRLNKVRDFPSSLHGYKLMRLEPKVVPEIVKFLEPTLKLRPIDWEPRYNLLPVTVSEIQTVPHTQQAPEKPAAKKAQPKAAEAPKPKAAEAPKQKINDADD